MKSDTTSPVSHVTLLRRRYPMRCRVKKGPLNAVPLVDLSLLIILFVMLNSWTMLRPGLSLQLPTAGFVHGAGKDASLMTITREQFIFFNDERVALDLLPKRLSAVARKSPNPALILEADRRVSHDLMIQIYTLAVQAGFTEVIVATQVQQHEEELR